MARRARMSSVTGIYHIVICGREYREIFHDAEDFSNMLSIIGKAKRDKGFQLLAYCLMDNHAHILLKEGLDALSTSMRRITVGYAKYYQKKYEQLGHVFQDRFKSEPVEIINNLPQLIDFIHCNPIKAGIISKAGVYRWSSYGSYSHANGEQDDQTDVLVLQKILKEYGMQDYTPAEEVNAIKIGFLEVMGISEEHIDTADIPVIVSGIMREYALKLEDLHELVDKAKRDLVLAELRQATKMPIRRLAAMTGLSKDIVFRADKNISKYQ